VGCADLMTVELPPELAGPAVGTFTVCIDGDCDDTAFDGVVPAGDSMDFPLNGNKPGERVDVVLVLDDGRSYEAHGSLIALRPNGPECGPVCSSTHLVLAPS